MRCRGTRPVMFRILLVEDNEMNRDMLSRRLRRKGFMVSIAPDGPQGLSKARSDRPDLILMDLSLPGIDGWEATRRLKADPVTSSIPIIALTAHAMAGDRERAFEAGCDDYDMKPIDFARLLAKIEVILVNPDDPHSKPLPSHSKNGEARAEPNLLADPGQLRHDLISPLVRIIGYCELLGEDAQAVGQLEQVEGLQSIRSLAHEIRRAIDGILLGPTDSESRPPIDLETLASTVLPPAHSIIQTSESLKDAASKLLDRGSVVEDLDRIRNDALLLVRMIWQVSGDRVKSKT